MGKPGSSKTLQGLEGAWEGSLAQGEGFFFPGTKKRECVVVEHVARLFLLFFLRLVQGEEKSCYRCSG